MNDILDLKIVVSQHITYFYEWELYVSLLTSLLDYLTVRKIKMVLQCEIALLAFHHGYEKSNPFIFSVYKIYPNSYGDE